MKFLRFASYAAAGYLSILGVASAQGFDPMGELGKGAAKLSDLTGDRLFLSGYFNAHYMDHDGVQRLVGRDLNEPLFQVREASLFFDIVPSQYLTFSGEAEFSFEFSKEIASGRDQGVYAHLNFLYADLDVNSIAGLDPSAAGQFNIQLGKILVPFLGYNGDKANFRQALMSQPFTAWQLAPVNNVAISFERFGWTDFGASLTWRRQLGDVGLVNASLAIVNGLRSDSVAFDGNTVQLDTGGMMTPTVVPRDGFFDNRTHDWWFAEDNNDDKAIVARVSFRPLELPLALGLSYYTGDWNADGDQNLRMIGAHAQYLGEILHMKGEFVRADVEEQAGLLITTAMGPAVLNTTTGDYSAKAWYVEGGAKVLRYGENKSRYVRLVGRYDAVDTNDEAAFTPFDRSRFTIGGEWEFLNQIRLRYEYQRSRLHDFDNAPAPFIAAGGAEHVNMNMFSIIGYF